MKPTVVRRGNYTARVYCVPWGGKKRWQVWWRFGGKTYRKKFTSKKAALHLAGEKATQIANGHSAKLRLTETSAYEAERASEILKPFGVTILEVAYDYAARQRTTEESGCNTTVA